MVHSGHGLPMMATVSPAAIRYSRASPHASAATRSASSRHVVSRQMPSSLARNATRSGRERARSTSRPGKVLARSASKFMPGRIIPEGQEPPGALRRMTRRARDRVSAALRYRVLDWKPKGDGGLLLEHGVGNRRERRRGLDSPDRGVVAGGVLRGFPHGPRPYRTVPENTDLHDYPRCLVVAVLEQGFPPFALAGGMKQLRSDRLTYAGQIAARRRIEIRACDAGRFDAICRGLRY